MWGLPLVYEMALAALLVCLISWLLGRTLCKSREHEERAAKKALQATNERLETLLIKKDEEIQQVSARMHSGQQAAAELRHQHQTTENLLAKSQQEHRESLADIQKLTAYRTQFDELEKIHAKQSRQVITLQETIKQMQNDMAQTATLGEEQRNALETTILQLQEDKKNADALITEQQAALTSYRRKQQTFENEVDNQDAQIAQLRKQIADLQTDNEIQRETIESLNAKVNGYLQSVNSTNRRIASMLDTLPGSG